MIQARRYCAYYMWLTRFMKDWLQKSGVVAWRREPSSPPDWRSQRSCQSTSPLEPWQVDGLSLMLAELLPAHQVLSANDLTMARLDSSLAERSIRQLRVLCRLPEAPILWAKDYINGYEYVFREVAIIGTRVSQTHLQALASQKSVAVRPQSAKLVYDLLGATIPDPFGLIHPRKTNQSIINAKPNYLAPSLQQIKQGQLNVYQACALSNQLRLDYSPISVAYEAILRHTQHRTKAHELADDRNSLVEAGKRDGEKKFSFEVLSNVGDLAHHYLEVLSSFPYINQRFMELSRVLELGRTLIDLYAAGGISHIAFLPDQTIAVPRPALHFSAFPNRQLHNDDGPAVTWPKSIESLWARLGTIVPSILVKDPDKITIQAIDTEPDAEVRHLLMQQYIGPNPRDGLRGIERYMRDSGAKLIDDDPVFGRLWSRQAGFSDNDVDAEIMMIEIPNFSPKLGALKTCWRRVPPTMYSARQAAAWTFGLPAGAYAPIVET